MNIICANYYFNLLLEKKKDKQVTAVCGLQPAVMKKHQIPTSEHF